MTVSTIILAAGKGTRMKSPTPKILHKIAGKHLIAFSVDLAKAVKSKETIVVVGTELTVRVRNSGSATLLNQILNMSRIGLLYGLFLEAFKLL